MNKLSIFLIGNFLSSILFAGALVAYSDESPFGASTPLIYFTIHFIFIGTTFPLYVSRLKRDTKVLSYKDYLIFPFFLVSLIPMFLACFHFSKQPQVESIKEIPFYVFMGFGVSALIIIFLFKFSESGYKKIPLTREN